MAHATVSAPTVLFRMTSDSFLRLPDSELDIQLLDGEVVVLPRPVPPHQYFLAGLITVLNNWVKPRELGRVLTEVLIRLNGKWSPAPDISFLKTAHLGRVKAKRIVGPVDLAVEIVSRSSARIDRKTKFAAYALLGIPWYWIVDLKKRVLEENECVRKTYGKPVRVPFDKLLEPRLFPGLKIDLASLEW